MEEEVRGDQQKKNGKEENFYSEVVPNLIPASNTRARSSLPQTLLQIAGIDLQSNFVLKLERDIPLVAWRDGRGV